jgi:ABC-type multidrug transport system fused ATPase/permease subunit
MQTLKKFLFLLTPFERKRAYLLIIMIIIMALLDMIGVASVLPFMAVLANPSIVETNLILNEIFHASKIFSIVNHAQFIFALGVLSFVVLVSSLAFKTLATYMQLRFVYLREYSINKRLIEGYLHQPYSWFLSRHSADFGKTILSEVQQLIEIGLAPLLDFIAKGAIVIALVTLLFLIDPMLALIVGLTLGVSYGSVFYFIRRFVNRSGKTRLKNNQLRFKVVNEAFSAIKEIKVGGLEQFYIKNFSDFALRHAHSIASLNIMYQLPRFIFEALAFGGVMLMMLYLMMQTGTFEKSIPLIALYVFVGYRLMPALQQIYVSFTQLTFVGPSLDKLYEDMKNLKSFNLNHDQDILFFNKAITLKNIYYNYPYTSRTTLKDISITIPIKTIIGLVGATGSGKTTIVDIILGLLEPQKGTLEVDGQIITKQNLRVWQRCIGYVPQHIYLSDDTVAANIAFGLAPEEINQDAVEKASKIANLHEFITDELPNQYQTIIGERGVKLSGGQRQRIGIARALYKNPKVLILDEATSSLDNQTEKAVMDAISNIGKNITIILIAHRLNTVKKCDIIFLLDKGELKSKGTFEELINDNNQFEYNPK